jgi:DNA-binding transcriptional LysR family regulator
MKLKSLNINNLNLNGLLHFHVIAKNRSLSRAAKELNLSAPAITHSLNNLETALKEKLCIRNRSGFHLTPAGLRLFEATQVIVSQLQKYSVAQEDPKEYSGILSLGVLDHFANHQIESAIHKISIKFPKMKLNIQSYDSDKMNELLLEKELDIGFGTFSNRLPRLKYIKIGEEKLQYYISNHHPLWKKKTISKEDLIGQKTTWLDNRNRTRSDLEMNIFMENLKYKMQFYGFSNNLSAAVQILVSGHAIVPLPETFGDSICKSHPVRKIEVETKSKIIDEVLVYNPTGFDNLPAKELLQEILK